MALTAAVDRMWGRFVGGLAAAGAFSLAFATVAIVVDVTLRNIGQRPLQWSSAVVEYIMLGATMAGGPYLVRTHGHVAVTSLVSTLGEGTRATLRRVLNLLCAAILAFLAWRAALLGIEAHASGAMDIRSVIVPGYVSYLMLTLGFALMAAEFVRLFVLRDPGPAGPGSHA